MNVTSINQLPFVKPNDDFIGNLEKNDIGNDVDWFKMGFDFKSLTADKLKINVDYMTSRYVVLKETKAREFSNRVGGFLEENCAAREKEKIYTSIIEEFSNKANGCKIFKAKLEQHTD